MSTFDTFDLPPSLRESLATAGITAPTPIQASAIPAGLRGADVLASAQTGTGKTIAYLVPVLTRIINSKDDSVLILAPTRELATQVIREASLLLGNNRRDVALLIGGEPMYPQYAALKRKPRVVIGTPGRVMDHLNRGSLQLNLMRMLVLDETDRMLDIGFSDAIEEIVSQMPAERQTFMFSATIAPAIAKLAQKYLTDPERISVGEAMQASSKIKQETIKLANSQKFSHLLTELDSREGSVIIFVKTKMGAEQLADKLKDQNHRADAIHGDLRQRKRDQVIRSFRNQKSRIMVATDVAARGLDIPHIMHVINYDLPQCPEDYIHRIGRTGRADMEGFALSFISPDDNRKWQLIHRMLNPTSARDLDAGIGSGRKQGGNSGRFGRSNDRNNGPRKPFGSSFGRDRDQRDGERERGFRSERRDDRPARGPSRGDDFAPRQRSSDDRAPQRAFRSNNERFQSPRGGDERPAFSRERRSDDRPAFSRDRRSDDRPAFPRRDDDRRGNGRSDERPTFARRGDDRRSDDRRTNDRPAFARRSDDRPAQGRRGENRPAQARSRDDRLAPARKQGDDRFARGQSSDSRRPQGTREGSWKKREGGSSADGRPSTGAKKPAWLAKKYPAQHERRVD